ncbi:N-acetylmuramoyl-L-alanine amidase [Streptomyces massasporeus]|uniref:peptidoglycan recognition protein family protein n=1 Tax=Streptomyces massasporeus TaxID=67324 RepID=UPI0036BEB15F
MTADTFIRVLREEGVKISEYPGWRTRERDDETGLVFGPVRMILNHHTAGRNSRDIVARDGVPGLPPPLAHIHLAKDGVATMCSDGRANHAGPMAVNAYQSFRDEAAVHPAPSKTSGTIDGNDVSYGIETENLGNGTDVYPRAQYDAWVRVNAAICRHYGWSAESVGCHKETSVEGKPDPRGPVEGYGSRGRFEFTPKQLRADVAERLRHERTWSPGEEEDDMPTPAEFAKAVLTLDGVINVPGAPATNPTWTLSSVQTEILKRIDKVAAREASQSAAIAELTKTVAALAENRTEIDADALVARIQQAIESIDIRLETTTG